MSGMRGGPRLICSPYLTGSLAFMLVLVGFNYWSVSTQNHDLFIKVADLQQQLKLGSDEVVHMKSKYSNLEDQHKTSIDNNLQCESEKADLEKQIQSETETHDRVKETLESKINQLTSDKAKLEEDVSTLREERLQIIQQRDEAQTQKDQADVDKAQCLQVESAASEQLKRQLADEQAKAADLQSKLAELLARRPALPNQSGDIVSNSYLGPGQLPNVDPSKVQVVKKDTLGMKFHKDESGHYMPIIVAGDPSSPRAKPRFSVGGPVTKSRIKHSINAGPPGLNLLPPIVSGDSKSSNQSIVRGISSTSTTTTTSSSVSAQAYSNQSDPLPESVSKEDNMSPSQASIVDEEDVTNIMEKLDHSQEKERENQSGKRSVDTIDENNSAREINLDRGEADSFIPELVNGAEGKKEILNDDQDPGGELDNSEIADQDEMDESLDEDKSEIDNTKHNDKNQDIEVT